MTLHFVHGAPPAGLAAVPGDAVQCSPLVPGASLLEAVESGRAASVVMVAPPGTIERRYALAQALRVLAPGGRLTVLGPKDKGGSRIAGELTGFGCAVASDSRSHWRICSTLRPEAPAGLDEAIEAGAARRDAALGLWTQPGVFSWDRVDEGSALLLDAMERPLQGHGADLGCGLGLLMREVLARGPAVTALEGVELDARAIAAARCNVADERAQFHWRDVREGLPFEELDFVVMNPPFHSGGADDVGLGRIFLQRARAVLRPGGLLWMVANRHLPYEADLAALFSKVQTMSESPRFKIVRAIA